MTYYGPKELAASFRTVRKNTIQIAEEIPEKDYGYRATPESRSVAETLVHIAVASRLQEQIHVVEHLQYAGGFRFLRLPGEADRRGEEAAIEERRFSNCCARRARDTPRCSKG